MAREGDISETSWFAASLSVVAALAVANLVLGSTDFSGVLMIGPLMASTQIRAGKTAMVSAVAVVVAGATMTLLHEEWEAAPLIRFLGVAAGGAFAVAAARWREGRERKLTAVTRVAEVAQHAILAPLPRRLGCVRLASRYRSAAAEAVVGGDFYDAIETRSGVTILIGDVKGKGLDAVRAAARVVGAFRLAALRDEGLDEVARDLHDCVSAGLGDEDFVTALLMEFTTLGTVEAVNCGHPPPILISETPKPLVLCVSPPLGLAGVADGFTVERVDLPPAWRVLLHTDGLLEARGPGGAFMDVEAAVAAEAGVFEDDEFLGRLLQHVDAHTEQSLGDDMALLLISAAQTLPKNEVSPQLVDSVFPGPESTSR